MRPGYFRIDFFLQCQILPVRIIEKILISVEGIRRLILRLKTLFSYRINYIVHPKNWEGFLREDF